MATTLLPDWGRFPPSETIQGAIAVAAELLASYQGDADKAGEVEDERYYQGGADALYTLLSFVTFPQNESQARLCIHRNLVWLGHECAVCTDYGTEWLVDE